MANTAAAKKAIRSGARKRAGNDAWRRRFVALRRKWRNALNEKKREDAVALSRELQKTLDRMARRNIMHPNAAARRNARIAAAVRRLAA